MQAISYKLAKLEDFPLYQVAEGAPFEAADVKAARPIITGPSRGFIGGAVGSMGTLRSHIHSPSIKLQGHGKVDVITPHLVQSD